MRVREKPKGVLPAPEKEAPEEFGARDADEAPRRGSKGIPRGAADWQHLPRERNSSCFLHFAHRLGEIVFHEEASAAPQRESPSN
jgi:hypothetical protein